MAKAIVDSTGIVSRLHLLSMIRDPFVRAAFERADRDHGEPAMVPAPVPRPTLAGGAEARQDGRCAAPTCEGPIGDLPVVDATAMVPDASGRESTVRIRRRVEQMVEELIDALDRLDAPGEDLEDVGDDEPSLGGPEGAESQLPWCAGVDDERELDAVRP